MKSFVSEAHTSTSTLEKKSPDKEDNMSSESTEEDIDILLKGITELDFEHPCIQKKILQRSFNIWSNSQPTRTRATKRKIYEFSSLSAKCEAAIEQDHREIS